MSKRVKWIIGGSILLIGVIVGLLLYNEWFGFGGPVSSGALAPTLESAASQQVVYRIDTTQSSVQYTVDETFAGQPMSTATGITRQIAGDILLDQADYAQSQVGTIVINVELFESDSGLRDRRIRREFLESSTYPEATFAPTALVDFPEAVVEGTAYTFQMVGDLTIKETTQSVTWDVSATLDGEQLTGSASTTLSMMNFDVGPISIAGLVETEDAVRLDFQFVAVAVDESASSTATATP
jgi:polyisoprenoid-binding protein YceI